LNGPRGSGDGGDGGGGGDGLLILLILVVTRRLRQRCFVLFVGHQTDFFFFGSEFRLRNPGRGCGGGGGGGGTNGKGDAAAALVSVHINKVSAVGAYPLPLIPVRTSFARVQVPVADDLRKLEWVGVRTFARAVVAAMSAIGPAGIVGVVLGLAMGVTIIIVARCPMQRGVVVGGRASGRNRR
jgi:hypothetical protein